ncbi:MAG: hypothetical protein FWD58_09735 [Firmicutes bacterium]|nr:hypothetical protein [Bacillota bacterium]
MIFNKNTIYATVWKITPAENGKYIDLQITTSEKNADSGYVNSGWYPRAVGKAVEALSGLKVKDRIVIKQSKFTNERKEGEDGKKKSVFRFLILEAHIDGKENHKSAGQAPPAQEEEDPF